MSSQGSRRKPVPRAQLRASEVAEREALRSVGLRNLLAQHLGGHEHAVDTSGDDNRDRLVEKLRAFAGQSKRSPSGVDTRAAARKLGVTPRTVQRWIKGTHQPSADHWKSIREGSRKAATHKRQRAKAVQDLSARFSRGGWVRIEGVAGPLGLRQDAGQSGYARFRNVEVTMSPDTANMLLDAYVDRGVDGAVDALYEIYGEEQMKDWGFETIEDLELRDESQGSRKNLEQQKLRAAKEKAQARAAQRRARPSEPDVLDLDWGI